MKNLLMTKSSDCKSDLFKGTLQDRIKVLVNVCF